jgi:hypothetical protein
MTKIKVANRNQFAFGAVPVIALVSGVSGRSRNCRRKKLIRSMKMLSLGAALTCLLSTQILSAQSTPSAARPEQGRACDQSVIDQLLRRDTGGPQQFVLNCSTTLPYGSLITKNVVFEGSAASGTVFDCNQSTIDVTAGTTTLERIAIIVRSVRTPDGTWDPPQHVTIKNCHINGFIRVLGLAYTAGGEDVKQSSMQPDHTAFLQASSPREVELNNLKINSPGNVALYIGPGVTKTALEGSEISGTTRSTAVYMDAESAENVISNNVFNIRSTKRELIALDGSAKNKILGNRFEDPAYGGIFLYRNCGEGGTIRHQKPEYNIIVGNTFNYASVITQKPAVWLGSRGGTQPYCFSDPRHPYGSSLSPLDFAQDNTVAENAIIGGSRALIRSDNFPNSITTNFSLEQPSGRASGSRGIQP